MTKRICIGVLMGIVAGGCGLLRDPRANCNHPKHEEYVREQQATRLAKQTRSYAKPGKGPKKAQKSCPNS